MHSRTLIITGASRGLGAVTARIAAEKFKVSTVLVARSKEPLRKVAEEVIGAGGSAWVVAGDISQPGDCQRVVQEMLDHFGRIDGLVNNAGVIEPIARIGDADPDDWQRNWATNVLGPVLLTRFALEELRQRNGTIINITSGATTVAIPGWGAYSTSKSALDHFTRILAAEEPQITAIGFRPGIVDTEMQATIRARGKMSMADADYGRLAGMHAQGKLLPVETPAQMMACLALFAPHEWSGKVLAWNEEPVQQFTYSLMNQP